MSCLDCPVQFIVSHSVLVIVSRLLGELLRRQICCYFINYKQVIFPFTITMSNQIYEDVRKYRREDRADK